MSTLSDAIVSRIRRGSGYEQTATGYTMGSSSDLGMRVT
jgi:hypothetical protein